MVAPPKMAMKSKTVSKISAVAAASKNSKAAAKRAREEADIKEDVEKSGSKEEEELEDASEEKASKMEVEESESQSSEEESSEEEESEEESEEEAKEMSEKQKEAETVAARKKELKAMAAGELKDLLSSKGLETGKKEVMIETFVKYEAKERADAREKAAKIRAVVVQKKESLEALSAPELKEECTTMGIKGSLTKEARVEELLKLWQEDGGVDKALAKMARDAREEVLVSMDKKALRKLCDKMGVDPFVKEVMVQRIVKQESDAGRFSRPKLEQKEEAPASSKKCDMVDALIANEANRKKEMELRKQQEEAEASKRKGLKAMSTEELKKALKKKGIEAAAKKEDMVEQLFAVGVQEEALAARKSELNSLSVDDLKKLVLSKGLEADKRNAMVEAIFDHEAKVREELRAWEVKLVEAAKKMEKELDTKSAAELKDLCASKGLKLGTSKEDRMQSLLEEAAKNGELDKVLAGMARVARREVLLATNMPALEKLCNGANIDPLVKEVMVERIIEHEVEFGKVVEPPAKKARVSKK